jgi:hypothetical protein
MKILVATPTIPSRKADPFLEPCRLKRKEFVDRYNMIQMELMEQTVLSERYEHARQFGLDHGFDFLFTYEDDILPPNNFVDLLLEPIKKIGAQCVCGITPLRPWSTRNDHVVYVPTRHVPLEENVLNSRIIRVEQIVPGLRSEPYFPIAHGTIAGPCFISLKLDIPFRTGTTGPRPLIDDGWDLAFSDDLCAKTPFYCCPAAVSKHYCIDTHNIYT